MSLWVNHRMRHIQSSSYRLITQIQINLQNEIDTLWKLEVNPNRIKI